MMYKNYNLMNSYLVIWSNKTNMVNKKMRVLMFGWEFPPVKSGGLGTACLGLTQGLSSHPLDITFVLPYLSQLHGEDFLTFEGLLNTKKYQKIQVELVDSALQAYGSEESYRSFSESYLQSLSMKEGDQEFVYSGNLYEEVHRYAAIAGQYSVDKDYDIVHCHDWMTYLAGVEVKRKRGVPMVAHVHATEHDRTGGNPQQRVYDIERKGMHSADLILAVSNFTKKTIVEKYGIASEKVEVVHNGIDSSVQNFESEEVVFKSEDDLVLFLGRITIQKGPDYFVKAAEKVLQFYPKAKFVFAGSGDMEKKMINMVAQMGLAKHFFFTGFAKGHQVDRLFQLADVYVMPSISEPFGITPLESIKNGTPVIISKQSGVSEVVQHCLKMDFWDTHKLANYIIAVLKHKHTLGREMVRHSKRELQGLTWEVAGQKVMRCYKRLVA